MDWIIDTTKGCFQGKTCKQVLKNMAEYYAIRNEQPNEIISVVAYKKNNDVKEVCKTGRENLQNWLENKVDELQKEIQENFEEQENLQSDYYHSVL